MCSVDSENSGTSASSAVQASAKTARSASSQWVSSIIRAGTVLASVGRISRRRGSMVPSSSIRLVAGTCTAARPERLLTRRRALGSSSQSSASASAVGVFRRFSAIVSSWVSAPEPGWV